MSKDLFTHLILKSFREKLTADERRRLEAWLAEDVSHRQLFEQLKTSWEQAGPYKSDFQVDLDAGWDRIQARIRTEVPAAPKVIPIWRQPAVRIAASLVLLVGMVWAAFQLFTGGPDEPAFATVITADHEVRQIDLPDGSTVWLNGNSRLVYPEALEERSLRLEGEARFEVEHDPSRPFRVDAVGTRTTVLGTTFNVDARSREVTVSLMEGRVAFAAGEQPAVELAPGESAAFDPSTGKIDRFDTPTGNTDAWRTRELAFEGTALAAVVSDLEDYFGMPIALEADNGLNCTFTGTFTEPSIDQILEVLEFTFDLDHEEIDGQLRLLLRDCR